MFFVRRSAIGEVKLPIRSKVTARGSWFNLTSTINFSSKQHRGNVGEGQFHIKKNNIDYHIKNYLVKTLTYEEMWELLIK